MSRTLNVSHKVNTNSISYMLLIFVSTNNLVYAAHVYIQIVVAYAAEYSKFVKPFAWCANSAQVTSSLLSFNLRTNLGTGRV